MKQAAADVKATEQPCKPDWRYLQQTYDTTKEQAAATGQKAQGEPASRWEQTQSTLGAAAQGTKDTAASCNHHCCGHCQGLGRPCSALLPLCCTAQPADFPA